MAYSDFEVVIGLEVHAQLQTESKMFCSCPVRFGAGDNENTCPVCTGQPGALPTINSRAVELSVKMGTALGCSIDPQSVFARKNYFYPDMSRGYQISQYDRPICGEGKFRFFHGVDERVVRIERAHMEEDAGKSSHQMNHSLINYNRASTPLLEIVSAPDLRSPEEASSYARAIRRVLRYLKICDGNLEEGSMRCDCNISVRRKGESALGVKVEIKNLNSFRFIEKALSFETERQIDIIETGGEVVQETRLYDIDKNQTFTMRTKEEAADYRYFPEPDLVPLQLSPEVILSWQKAVPELPVERRDRFVDEMGLSISVAESLTDEVEWADYFERVVSHVNEPRIAANWILGDLAHLLNENTCTISESPISAERLASLLELIVQKKISGTAGKTVLQEMWSTEITAEILVEKLGLAQMDDLEMIESLVDTVLKKSVEQVEDYRNGKEKLFGFFVGQIMRESKGKANPEKVAEILKKRLQRE